MRNLFKKQGTFILYGFVFWLPVILVIYIGILLFSNAEKVGRMILGIVVPEKYLYAGLGVVLFILIVYFSGMLLKLTKVGNLFSKIPFIGLFFGHGEMMTLARLGHLQPCLFLYSPTCISYGWILSEQKVQLDEGKADFSLMCVYFPNVPTLVTGSVFAVRKDAVMKLGNSTTEVIDLLLYTIQSPPFLQYLPWEDESREEFRKRSKIFGLN